MQLLFFEDDSSDGRAPDYTGNVSLWNVVGCLVGSKHDSFLAEL